MLTSLNNHYKVLIGHYLKDFESTKSYDCYGTLIDRQYVLTTANCVTDITNHSVVVRMNQKSEYIKPTDPNLPYKEYYPYQEEVLVSQIYIHPNFSKMPLENDLALLHLEFHDISFNRYFKPACLWTHDLLSVREFQTNGHGPQKTADLYDTSPDDGQEIELYLNSKVLVNCPMNLTAHQICVGDAYTLVPGVCKNNFGSAMSREIWVFKSYIFDYIFAVNNQGENCGLNTPSIFTKIAPFINWIDSIVFADNVKYEDSSVYYGDECITLNGPGVCLTLDECPGTMKQVVDGNITDLSELLCGFEKDVSLVCCTNVDCFQTPTSNERIKKALGEIENCSDMYIDFRPSNVLDNPQEEIVTYVATLKSTLSNVTCDATLISSYFLVTTASCYIRFSNSDDVVVLIGQLQNNTVEKAFIHPRFDLNLRNNNIAVLKLATSISISKDVIPACLWRNHSHVPLILHGTSNGEKPLYVYPIYRKNCVKEKLTNFTESELCVLKLYGTLESLVYSDGGTGLYNHWSDEQYEVQISYLVGLFNRGSVCEKCNKGVFTKISHHFGWIKSVIYRNA
ncbi:uncharacterized protein LOC131440484 isoform X2 [Malaya genurostris]|nr:uncharacterized protein LOC131440484 isoform X2 [Malaya genurostris]XP_058467784.1 uncharacterized protein LOC131440484 isoform X2 [Malaya genurostris]